MQSAPLQSGRKGREMAENNVQDATYYLRRMVDQVPSMLAYWDRTLRCRFANAAYRTWFGVDPARLVGTSLRDLLGPELYALNEPHALAALHGEEQTFERAIQGADGVVRYSLANYQPDVVDGQVRGFIATVTEVTRLKQTEANLRGVVGTLEAEIRRRRTAEESLRESQQSLAVTLATIDAGFVATDRDGRVTRMNAVSERLTGWPQAEALGRPLFEVLVREDRPAAVAAMNPVDVMISQALGADDARNVIVVSRQGARTPVEVKAALTHDKAGAVHGIALVMRDISQELAAEIEASRLAAIVESSEDAIIGKTLDGRITSWNSAAQALFGYTADEAIGLPVQMLIPSDRQEEEMRILASLARGMRVPVFETLRRAKDGRLREVSITISPIRDAHGRIAGASKIIRDVSARNKAERARLRAERLEAENRQILQATRLKSQFLANMSHELRTPLNAIIGFAELLHTGVVRPESPKHHDFVGHIAASGRHLLQLINDVLDLAKVESGRFEFHPEPVDLPRLVREVADILHNGLLQKRHALALEIDPGLTGIVLDPARLKQVLYNYLSNAIKFTPEGGRITLRALAEGPAHLRIEVEDSGIGIDTDQIPRLFTEFQQLDAGYDKQHPGTGLGLALTRRLVEAQGGSVGVRSTRGAGSVFHLVLARVHGQEGGAAAPAAAGAAVPAQRLLVVEDDPLLRGRIVAALVEAGFGAEGAANAAQVSRLVEEAAFDGLTLDLQLPAQGGLPLLAGLRLEARHRRTPVLGVTMPAEPGTAASFAITDILAKPIHAEQVVAAMARLRPRAGDGLQVMVVDDDPLACDLMRATLAAAGIAAVCLVDGRQALREIDQHRPDAIVLDLMMPEFDGFAVLDALHRMPAWRETPVFIWTSMLLTDDEYACLARSAQAILGKGGGDLAIMLERLRRWQPGVVA